MLNLDYPNGQVLSSEDLPQVNTYGVYINVFVPDIIEEPFFSFMQILGK